MKEKQLLKCIFRNCGIKCCPNDWKKIITYYIYLNFEDTCDFRKNKIPPLSNGHNWKT